MLTYHGSDAERAERGRRRRGRAEPMAPDERRAAIIQSTLPLLRLYGAQVTTRQIAQAAGVAEGTIFRVFKDKDELIHAAIDAAFDPRSIEEFTATLSADQPLAERVELVADFLLQQNRSMVELMRGLHLAMKEQAGRAKGPPPGHGGPPHMRADYFRRSIDAIAAVLVLSDEPWTIGPTEAAELLVAMAIAAGVSIPWLSAGEELSAKTIARVLIHGALDTPHPASTNPETSTPLENPCS